MRARKVLSILAIIMLPTSFLFGHSSMAQQAQPQSDLARSILAIADDTCPTQTTLSRYQCPIDYHWAAIYAETMELKKFLADAYIRLGNADRAAEELETLRTDTDTLGTWVARLNAKYPKRE